MKARFVSRLVLAFGLCAVVPSANAAVCTFQTYNGHFLTAVGGGGRTTDVIHSDATWQRSWEMFRLVYSRDGSYGLLTMNRHFLTAVDGGGRTTDVIHSDATVLRAWEKFQFVYLGHQVYAIKTVNGHYLTAVDGGGRITDVIHSDATRIGNWEKFRLRCR
jgi:hypothetical protein